MKNIKLRNIKIKIYDVIQKKKKLTSQRTTLTSCKNMLI